VKEGARLQRSRREQSIREQSRIELMGQRAREERRIDLMGQRAREER
jgi:hypothetical protein